MLLAIDIGNTMISFGILKKQKLLKYYGVKTHLSKKKWKIEIVKTLKKVNRDFPSIKQSVICSVVPAVTTLISSIVENQFIMKPVIIGEDKVVPIKNLYRKPHQVGQDRLVGAYAAKILYGIPAVIIDFGTAITFDIVSKKGEYEGGMIVPGIQLSADSLFQKTALLPRIETIEGPRHLVGKDTKESILSGIFHGYGAMCAGLVNMIASELKVKPHIILTGGYTHIMKKYIHQKSYVIDRDLVFKGMDLIIGNSKF